MLTAKAKIKKQGKWRVIKIPKPLLKQFGLKNKDVVVEVNSDRIVIRPAKHPRDGWDESAREMAANGDDVLLDPYAPTQFDLEEWEW